MVASEDDGVVLLMSNKCEMGSIIKYGHGFKLAMKSKNINVSGEENK